MTFFEPNPRPVNGSIVAVVVAALLTLLLTGCMKNYGSFTFDDQVSQSFRNGSIQTGYRYYFAGRDNLPYAIIAIDPSYSVPSRNWVPFEPTPEQLQKMSANTMGAGEWVANGAYIRDPGGTVIGLWYSGLRSQSVRVDPDQRIVEVMFTVPQRGAP